MDVPRPESMEETDVIALLMRQHSLIEDLFQEVETASGEDRRRVWDQLVRLLAVHETAEEEIVHPIARHALDGGTAVIDDRLAEENEAKQLLAELAAMGPDDARFIPLLDKLRTSVLEHARAEERYEFAYLSEHSSPAQLRGMAAALKAAEALAPTRPHAGVESATANLLVGTPTAMMDRVRDVIRRALTA